jgi:protein SCO1/2
MRGAKKRQGIKLLLLLVTLAVPVIIFLFLKGYGENHYTVPVYYEEGIPADTADCLSENHPHAVDLSRLTSDFLPEHNGDLYEGKLSVMDVGINPADGLTKPGYPLKRVKDHFDLEKIVQFIVIRPITGFDPDKQSSADDRFKYIFGTMDQVSAFARCQLVLLDYPDHVDGSTRRFVLVDQWGRIRGYYPISDFDEVDRLILEMKIILKEEY